MHYGLPPVVVLCRESGGIVDAVDPLIGKVFAGRYRVDHLVGQGGMGFVYAATHLSMAKPVALKVLAPDLASDPTNVDRFEREAAASAELKHPNTIQIFDFGTSEDGQLYLAMELLQGRNLGQVLEAEGPLSPARTVGITRQILKSLKEAHAKGIVHRDLKPENVFLTDIHGESDFVKVLDFGIAKFMHSDRIKQTLTAQGFVCGTPLYVAPEQGLGYAASPATDIYSLGVMMYEMLAGAPPFSGDDPVTLVMMQVHSAPPPFEQNIQAGLPAGLSDMILKMMDKAPARRPKDAAEVLRKLASFRDLPDLVPGPATANDTEPEQPGRMEARKAPGRTTGIRQVSDEEVIARASEAPTVRVPFEPGRPARKKGMRSALSDVVTVLAVVALVVAGTVLYWQWNQKPQTTSSKQVCIESCLEEGFDQQTDGRTLHITEPTRQQCEEHCL